MPFLGKKPTEIASPVDINSGSIDGTTIGGGSASPATVTTFTSTGIDDNATSTAITIDSSQNVGIGDDSPTDQLSISKNSGNSIKLETFVGNGNDSHFKFHKARGGSSGPSQIGTTDDLGTITWSGYDGSSFNQAAFIKAKASTNTGDFNASLSFGTSSEDMRLDASGNLLVGKTLNSATDDGLSLLPSGRVNIVNNNGGSAVIVQSFYNDSASAAGYISITGTATSYNTSSDQRLKENVVSLDGAVDRIKQLSVHRFNFIADPNITVDGFLAHEVAEVVPEAITGTKDEVDDEGNPVYQGIDQSKLVPLLTAALQEALTKIDDLETRLSALEAN